MLICAGFCDNFAICYHSLALLFSIYSVPAYHSNFSQHQLKLLRCAKLDKTIKIKKLVSYAEVYAKEKEYTEDEKTNLIKFLKDSLDRKKLQRVKDVIYDKTLGEIKEIPALSYNKSSNHFTLKNLDAKRVSTLKSLPPKKLKGTLKNIEENDKYLNLIAH